MRRWDQIPNTIEIKNEFDIVPPDRPPILYKGNSFCDLEVILDYDLKT